MKKRFLLSLIAVSMSLAGCGKKDKDNEEETNEVTPPAGEVTPSGGETTPSGEETTPSGEEEQSHEEEDALTPEQRENANSLKSAIDLVLSFAYEKEVVSSVDSYTLAYAEEIAVAGARYEAVSSSLLDVMAIASQPSLEAVVEFVSALHEEGKLKDILYTGVAVGKSFLRAEAVANVEEGAKFAYVADYVDKEGVKVHSSLFGVLDSSFDFVSAFGDEKLLNSLVSIYNKETNQISLEAITGVLSHVSTAVLEFAKVESNVKYLVDLVSKGVVAFAKEFKALDEEEIADIEAYDFVGVIEEVFGKMTSFGSDLNNLTSEESPLPTIVELVNLALAGEYFQLATRIVDLYFAYIGSEVTVSQILLNVLCVASVVDSVVDSFASEEFLKEVGEVIGEDGKVVVSELKEVIVKVGENLEGISSVKPYLASLLDMFYEVNVLSYVAFGKATEDEAKEALGRFNGEAAVEYVFGYVDEFIAYVKSIGDPESDKFEFEIEQINSVIEAAQGGSPFSIVDAVVNAIAEILYHNSEIESLTLDEFKTRLMQITILGYAAYQFAISEGFMNLLWGALEYNSETKDITVSEEGLKALLSDGIYVFVGCGGEIASVLSTICGVLKEVLEGASKSELPELDLIISGLSYIGHELSVAADSLKDEEALGHFVPELVSIGNAALNAYVLIRDFVQTGVLDEARLLALAAQIAEIVNSLSPEAEIAPEELVPIEG